MTRKQKILSTKAKRPTHAILALAKSRPDRTIRWCEAAQIYLDCSESARQDERVGDTHYHMNLQQIFRRYFKRIKRGTYMLPVQDTVTL